MKIFTSGMLAILLACGSFCVSAQENNNRDVNNKILRGPYETNRFFDNVFMGVGAGVNIYEGEFDDFGSFGKRLAPALDIYVGKWLTPSTGFRVGYSGIQAKGWTSSRSAFAKGIDGKMFKEKFGVSYLHGDVMWNFSNAVSGYKETRTWNFIPFLGAGWARAYGNDTHEDEIAVSVGLLNNVRLCDLVDLTLEARQMFVNQRFDGVVGGRKGEGMTSVTVGVAFKLNRRNFKRAEKVDYSAYQNRIKALEGDNAKLANNNKALNEENEALRNRKPEVVDAEAKVSASPIVLFFKIGKATLDNKELVNLEFYVKHAMQADKNKTFTLIGSADKATGSKELNQRLSEQRMQYVYDLLVKKYGISKDRLIMKAEGDTNNRFDEPELNRAVIVE